MQSILVSLALSVALAFACPAPALAEAPGEGDATSATVDEAVSDTTDSSESAGEGQDGDAVAATDAETSASAADAAQSEEASEQASVDQAPSDIASGTFASNAAVSWALSSDGTLTISGTGAVSESGSAVPWDAYRGQIIRVVVTGSVSPSSLAGWFAGCGSLVSADLSGIVAGECASAARLFSGCPALSSVSGCDWELPEGADVTDAFAGTAIADDARPSWAQGTSSAEGESEAPRTSGLRRGPEADPVMHSGTFASNSFATWSLTRSGVLTIGGKGTVTETAGNLPWYEWRSTVTKVVTKGSVSPASMSQ
jgi:hypothetical protein